MSRCRTWIFMFDPSATYRYFCCGSLDSATSNAEPSPKRVLRDECLFHVSAVRLEHLNSIVGAIADIEQAVIRERDAVNRSAELLRWWLGRVVWRKFLVVGLVPIRAPVPLVFTCVRIEDDHPAVAISICHIEFVGFWVHQRFCREPQIFRIIAAFAVVGLADLHQKFT